MSNSPLIVYTKLSPNCSKMTNKVNKKITIHHMAGNCSIETCGAIFADASRKASSNYGIGSDGRIGLYVNECDRSWCSSSKSNDEQAVTIEVANNSGAPNWTISDKAYAALLNLCEDICRRNNIKKLNFTGDTSGNLTMHEWFADTTCPGPYLKSKFKAIATEVNNRLSKVEESVKARDESIPVNGYYKCTRGKKTQLAKNFVSTEFDCTGSKCCTETVIDVDLVKYLQKIRDHFGASVNLSSGYRCSTQNAKTANASSQSKHLYGMAADFTVKGVDPVEVAKYAESLGVLGIGLYDTATDGHFVHIDTRAAKSFWFGKSQAFRTTFGGKNVTDQDELLFLGDKGDRVKKLQQNLKDLGYSVSVSSKFDAKTETAVKQLQKDLKLTVDGIVGANTEAAIKKALEAKKNSIYGIDDFVREVQAIFGLNQTGVANTELLNKTVTVSSKVNKKHAVVKPIQKRLFAMGYTEVGEADGSAGSMFTKAVKRLQKEKGKTQDGEITKGQLTWKLLLGLVK